MQIDIKNLRNMYHKGCLRRGTWGHGHYCCLMSGLVPSAESREDCIEAGWPDWLVCLCITVFDNSGPLEADDRALAIGEGIAAYKGDWDDMHARLRYNFILPLIKDKLEETITNSRTIGDHLGEAFQRANEYRGHPIDNTLAAEVDDHKALLKEKELADDAHPHIIDDTSYLLLIIRGRQPSFHHLIYVHETKCVDELYEAFIKELRA